MSCKKRAQVYFRYVRHMIRALTCDNLIRNKFIIRKTDRLSVAVNVTHNAKAHAANNTVWDANDIFIRSLYGHIHIELKQLARLYCRVRDV